MSGLGDNIDVVYKASELVILIGGLFLVAARSGKTFQEIKGAMAQQSQEISELKQTVKELSKVVIDLARQEGRINLMEERVGAASRAMEERQMMTGKRLDDLTGRFNQWVDNHGNSVS